MIVRNNKFKKYKHAVLAVDVVIFTVEHRALEVLLIKMKKHPFEKDWALPGGLVRPDESVEAAAERHLLEKTGVKNTLLEQLHTFGRVNRDPFGRVVSVGHFALISNSGIRLSTGSEYEGVSWFKVSRLPSLAYDHREMLNMALNKLRDRVRFSNIVYGLLPREFSLADLQKTYEIILGKKLDKRNFRKKIMSLRVIEKTGRKVSGQASRPAALYKFVKRSLRTVEML